MKKGIAAKYFTIKELSEILYISEPSVRRDLADLERQNLIKRIHGGAVIEETALSKNKIPFFIREYEQSSAKSVIAQKAIELVKDEIEKVKRSITERELNKAKKKVKSRFACEVETVSDIGESIGYYMTVCDDLALAEDYIPACESITVTDLQEAAEKYLNLNHAVISILKPQG